MSGQARNMQGTAATVFHGNRPAIRVETMLLALFTWADTHKHALSFWAVSIAFLAMALTMPPSASADTFGPRKEMARPLDHGKTVIGPHLPS
jgi:hypothetical protein